MENNLTDKDIRILNKMYVILNMIVPVYHT